MQQETCAECGTPLESQDDKGRGGREQSYCSDRCRQAAYRREKAAQRKEEKRQSGAQTHWFDKKIALEVLRYRFQLGKEIIRIATGFFTVRGYNLLRAAAHDKRMYILVGLDDPGEKRVTDAAAGRAGRTRAHAVLRPAVRTADDRTRIRHQLPRPERCAEPGLGVGRS